MSGSRSRLGALVLGLMTGFAVGYYVHRWWGGGLFATTSVASAVALIAVGIAIVVAIVDALRTAGRGHAPRAATSATLAFALVTGVAAGVTLGPPFRGVSMFAGTLEVHVVTPALADWTWDVECSTETNSSEVAYILAGRWPHGGSSIDSLNLGFDAGAPTFRFGSETNYYDSTWPSPAEIEVQALDPTRLTGRLTFAGLQPRGPGYLPAFRGAPVAGTLMWACDPARPPTYP